MKRNSLVVMLLVCLLVYRQTAWSQADFARPVRMYNLGIYPDVKNPWLYYYLPDGLQLARKPDGSPDLNFLMMRYTGSALYEGREPDAIRYRNLLTMRVVMKQPDNDSLSLARQALSRRYGNIQLKPLPLNRMEAMLVFTPLQPKSESDTVLIRNGDLAMDKSTDGSTTNSVWQERYFTLFLDAYSAMLLQEAFEKELTAISFAYVLYANGNTQKRILDLDGFGRLAEKLKQQLAAATDSTVSVRECMVKSDAWSLSPDLKAHPALLKKIDINDAIPKGYVMLNIRNYDFANGLRNDLYEKTVELQATGAGGDPVTVAVTFSRGSPGIASYNFRFNYAVRPDQPYRYRIRELRNDGQESLSEWKTVTAWASVLDVTTRQ